MVSGRDGVRKRNYFHEVSMADRATKLLEGRREEEEKRQVEIIAMNRHHEVTKADRVLTSFLKRKKEIEVEEEFDMDRLE